MIAGRCPVRAPLPSRPPIFGPNLVDPLELIEHVQQDCLASRLFDPRDKSGDLGPHLCRFQHLGALADELQVESQRQGGLLYWYDVEEVSGLV